MRLFCGFRLFGQYRDISGIGVAWSSWRSSCRGGQRCDFWHHDRYLFALFYPGADSDRSGSWNSFRTTLLKKWNIFLGAFCVSIAGTIISACITAYVFGGVTSSGSSILVTLLHKLGLNMVASAFVVQIVTDYADRLISIAIVVAVLAVLSNSMKQQIREGKTNGQV